MDTFDAFIRRFPHRQSWLSTGVANTSALTGQIRQIKQHSAASPTSSAHLLDFWA